MATFQSHTSHKASLARKGRHVHADFSSREPAAREFSDLLDDAYLKMNRGQCDRRQVADALDVLVPAMRQRKLASNDEQWQGMIRTGRAHPLKDLLHEDPFTFRAYSKPRNYPGDAELLDLIYASEEQWPMPEATQLGRDVFSYTTDSPATDGVRARRGFVADLLDRLVEEVARPHVLSIAAGHLREANLSSAVKRKKLGRFVALDNDPISLGEVQRCYGCYGVETVHSGIRRLLTNQADLGSFDLVYSTGLFDYLKQPTARRLVWGMFQMLRPGGRLVVANFLPGVRDVGYMEVFMDWQLLYRTRQDMIDMTMEIPQEETRDISIFAEENQNIIFLTVTKN